MANRIEEFRTIVESMEADFAKFYDKENSSAGTRVRKALQDLAGLCKDVRKEVTELKTTRKAAKS